MNDYLSFYNGKKVLVTGHTGFKGSWLCKILINAGATVTGYSLEPPTSPSLFDISGIANEMGSHIGDVRDYDSMLAVFEAAQPEIVFHLAAQPIVREGYKDPRGTYETNVMGTVNVLECSRNCGSVRSFLNVTTDKVYKNNEWCWGYRETDSLDGFDPYSNSKSCSELVTHCYSRSLISDQFAVSTARAGNVIGGGDFASDRIIPDCIRAVLNGDPIIVRNPTSTRPYQHVLEPLMGYLMIAAAQYDDPSLAGSYNIGPRDDDCLTTGDLVDLFCMSWGEGAKWMAKPESNAPHEAGRLKLDCSLISDTFGWQPQWTIAECVQMTCQFGKVFQAHGDISTEMDREIETYLNN